MKRLVAILAAALAAFAIYTVTAPAGQEAVSPKRVAALEKKVATMQRQLKCINSVVGVSLFGDPNGTAGYVYKQPDGSLIATTALDLAEQGQTPSFYVPRVNGSCVSGSAFKLKLAAPTRAAKPTGR
jgi:hypothetical protein